MNKKTLHHITSLENYSSIRDNGINAKNGMIFLFNDVTYEAYGRQETVANNIAVNQLGLQDKSYVMFKVLRQGINSEIINDNVAEVSAKWQWYIRQDHISKRYVVLEGYYKNGQLASLDEFDEDLKKLGQHI